MADEKIELTAEMEQFVSYVENLKVIDLANLVKALEDRLGVSAAAPVAAVAAAPAAAAAPAEEKTEFDVVLTDVGANKIAVIKEIRAITGLGLGEAKAMTEGLPKTLKAAVAKDEAAGMKTKLEAAGAKVEVK